MHVCVGWGGGGVEFLKVVWSPWQTHSVFGHKKLDVTSSHFISLIFGTMFKQELCYKFMWLGHHSNQNVCVISNMCFCGQLSDKDNSN